MKSNINKQIVFHDAGFVNVTKDKGNLILDCEGVWDYSNNDTKQFNGKLYLLDVGQITDTENNCIIDDFKMVYEDAEILDLEIEDKSITLNVIWNKYNPSVEKYGFYKISCDEIKWEPLKVFDPLSFSKTQN